MTSSSKSDEYAALSQRLIRKAETELERGDEHQAAEKAWGAVATAVKSVAESRGWFHNQHDLIRAALGELVDEFNRTELHPLFHTAESMHTNFYEDWMTEDEVKIGIGRAKRLLQELQALQPEPPRPIPTRSNRQKRRWERLHGETWDDT